MNSNLKELDVEGHFSTDSFLATSAGAEVLNSDDEQLDDVPFLSHQLSPDQESFSEKFLRNILTHEYQNLMPRRREKFVEITKTVTVTEIINGGADKHPSSCEVKVTNVSPAGPHPVNVSIKHLHQKWRSCDELDSEEDYLNNKKGTVIHIQETHKPYEEIIGNGKKRDSGFVYEDVIHTKVEHEEKSRNRSKSQDPNSSSSSRIYFDRSGDNIIDLEFTHPILIESNSKTGNSTNENTSTTSTGRRKFADLRKKRVSTSTTTSTTEMEKVTTRTTKRRSTSSHSSSSRIQSKPEVQTLYYRKFVETNNEDHEKSRNDEDNASESSMVIHSDAENRPEAPIAPPRKRLGREESLHYYRDDDEVAREVNSEHKTNHYDKKEKRRVTMTSPEPGITSVSLNDSSNHQNLTAGITSVSMNDSCTDTSFESRFSTIPRSSKSNNKINHIHVNVIGPTSGNFETGPLPVIGRVGEDVTMNIFIEKPRRSETRRDSEDLRIRESSEPPPKPPRRSKWGDHVIGEPLATSTPMTTIERRMTRESGEGSEPPSRKSTRGSRPPDINIIGCENVTHDTRSPARTPATPIVVVNQNPSRRNSQDLLADSSAKRRKSTVTDIDWYAAFNMKDPSSPRNSILDDRKPSRETKRRASESSAFNQTVDIDLNQIFTCTGEFRILKDEKCQCNACQLIRMSETERALRKRKESKQYKIQSRTFSEHDSGAATLPSRHFTPPVEIILDDVFNPKPQSSRPSIFSSILDESSAAANTTNIDRNQVTSTTNQPVHANDNENQNQLLPHQLRGGIVQEEDSEVTTVTTMKTYSKAEGEKSPRRSSITRRISVDELKPDYKKKKNKSRGDIHLPPSDVSIDDIFTALSTKKEEPKSTFIVTRKQTAQDVDAIDFEREETPVVPPRSRNSSKTVEAVFSLDDIFSNFSGSKARNEQKDVSSNNISNQEEKTTDEEAELSKELEYIAKRIAEFGKHEEDIHQKPHEEQREGSSIVQHSSTANISLDDIFNKKTEERRDQRDDVTKEVDHIATRVAEFEKNREDIYQKSLEEVKQEASSVQPTSSRDISLDDIFYRKSEKADNRDELSKEVDHIATRVAEFEKNREDIQRKPHEETREEAAIVQPTAPTEVSLDDIFNQKPEKVDNRDSLKREVNHIATRVAEFEKNQEDIHQKPHDEQKEETSTVQPTTPTDISLDDVFIQKLKKENNQDELTKEVDHIATRVAEFERNQEDIHQTPHEEPKKETSIVQPTTPTDISLDDIFNQKPKAKDNRDELTKEVDHIATRVAEFEKNQDDIHQKPHEEQKEETSIIQPTTPTDISLDDIFNQKPKKEENRDELTKEVDHIATRVAEFEKNREDINQKSHDEPSKETSIVQPTSLADISLDDVFNQKPKKEDNRDELSKEIDHIAIRVAEFEKNREDIQLKPHGEPREEAATVQPTAPTDVSLDDIFNHKPEKVDNRDALTREVDHIATRVAQFEKNQEDIHQKSHEREKEEVLVVQPTTPTDISLDDIFNQKPKATDNRDELTKEVDHIATRVAEFEKNREDVHQKPHRESKAEDSVVQPTTPTEISIDDISNRKSKKEDNRDELTKEVDHIATRVAEFEKNQEEIHQTPHEGPKEEALIIQPTTPTEVSLDDIFNRKSKKEDNRDELTREVDHIATRVAEFERNQEDIHQTPHEEPKEETSIVQPTSPADIPLDDVFNQKLKKEDNQDDLTKEVDHIATRVAEFEKNQEDINQKTHEDKKEESLIIQPTTPTDISLDDIFNQKPKKEDNRDELTKEVDHIKTRVAEFERNQEDIHQKPHEENKQETLIVQPTTPTDISLGDIFNQKSKKEDNRDKLTREVDHIATRVAEFEKNREDVHRVPRIESKEETSIVQPTSPTDISLDDIFNQKLKKDDNRDDLTKEVDHIATRVAEFEKNQEEIHQTPHEENKQEALIIQPTTPTEVSLDDIFNQKPKEKDNRDSITREVDHIATRVAEFEKNREDVHRVPRIESKEETSIVQPTSPTDISLDDIFNQKPKTENNRDALTKEVDHIATRVAEFERNQEDVHQKPHEASKTEESVVKPTTPTEVSLDDIFNQKPKKEDSRDELTREVDHITTRVAEFEKNQEDIHQKPHEEPKEESAVIQPTTPTDISLDDVFNHKLQERDNRDELTKEVDHIATRVAEFEKNREDVYQTPHEEQKEETSIVQPTSPTDVSLDDIFNQKLKKEDNRDELTKEVDHIATRVAEFEKNREDVHQKPHEESKAEESVVKPTTPTDISLDDIFSNKSKERDNRGALTKEVDHITTRVIEFEKNQKETHQRRHEDPKEDVSIIQPTPPTDISLDDIFNQSSSKQATRTIKTSEEVGHNVNKVAEYEENREQEPRKPTIHTSDAGISLDDIFTQKSSESTKTTQTTTETEDSSLTIENERKQVDLSSDRNTVQLQKKVRNLIPPANWQDSFVSTTSTISLDDGFGLSLRNTNNFGTSQREIIPTQTPPNSDSEQESKAPGYNYPEAVKVDINLEDVFSSPPMTEVTTVEPIDRRKSLQLPVDNWIDEIVAKTTDEATREAPKTPKTPKTPVQQLIDESKNGNFPSPTRISSEIQIEWIADILKDTEGESHPIEEHFEQKDDKSWVSNAIYRPTTETSTYNLRASQVYSDEENIVSESQEDTEKPTTSADVSWIESMLQEIGRTPIEDRSHDEQHPEVVLRKKTTTTTTTTDDNSFLEEVFRKFECKNHGESKKCDCSACRLTKLSDEEMEELKRRWKERKNVEAPQISRKAGSEEVTRKTSIPEASDISMDDIFSYSQRSEEATVIYDLHNSTQGQVTATKNQKSIATTSASIDLNEIFPTSDLSVNTSYYSKDDQVPSTSSPSVRSTVVHQLSPTVSETVTRTTRWKDESDISLDDVFGTSSSRRFSNYYQDPTGYDTVRSEDSGVASGGGRTTVDVVIDEAFKGVFDDQAPSVSNTNQKVTQLHHQHQEERSRTPINSYDDYYITSMIETEETDSEVDPENLDVSNFVDDILGKSLDEAAFRTTTKSFKNHTDTSIDRKLSSNETARLHPYYRTRTDTSIDTKRNRRVVISEQVSTIEDNSEFYTEPAGFSHDDIMNLIFVESSENQQDNEVQQETSTSSSKIVETTSEPADKPSGEEFLEIEIKPSYFLIKGSYSISIPKDEPLGQLLEKIRKEDRNGSLATLDFSLTRRLKKLLMSCLKEKAMKMDNKDENIYQGVSHRGRNIVSSIDMASVTFLAMNQNKYDPKKNPRGIVNFCTAENNLCTPLLEERFKHLELFIPNTEHLVRYPPSGGWPETRQTLSNYFQEFMHAQVDPSELVLTASTRTGYDVVSYCLFEEDDILLTNGPVYTGTISNVNERSQCVVEVVPSDLKNPRLEISKYESELQKHHGLDNTVGGIIIVNPQNPMGVVFPPEDVIELCNWASSNNLHVIIDEVFANCVFDKNARFKSFLSYRHRVSKPENVAYLWSVSKDFGLPGLKFAVIHSENAALRAAAVKFQLYYPCSAFVQDFAVKLLSDSVWLHYFHSEVKRRMMIHYTYTIQNLERLEIPYVPAQAGIFVFADFSKYMTSNDEAAELDLFKRLGDGGVMLTAGVHQKCHVYGWFRIVFACTQEELQEGIRRLYILLGSTLQPIGSVDYEL